MPVQHLFPTLIYDATLPAKTAEALNARLQRECEQLEHDDEAGRRWSAQNYLGGYTSYNSACRMHELSPTFGKLQRLIDRHVQKYAQALHFDLSDKTLVMTDCWVNIMAQHVSHGSHLHPLSTISGAYYVRTPRGSPGLKLEDPRLDRFMAAPPRRPDAPPEQRPWMVIPAQPGRFVLFESWLRHEVPANPTRARRISISFNYSWF